MALVAERRFAAMLILLLTSVWSAGCKDPLGVTRSVSGEVRTPEGGALDGVSVSVYRIAPDEDWNAARSQAPGAGFNAGQQWLFDHRIQSPIATATTDGNGRFSVNAQTEGESICLFFSRNGYGWAYRYNAGDNVGTVTMAPETTLPDFIIEEPTVTFFAGRSYRVAGAPLVLSTGGNVVFEPGCIIRFEQGASLTVQGQRVLINGAADNPVRFTSASTSSAREAWVGIFCGGSLGSVDSGVVVSNARVDFATDGLSITNNSKAQVENSVFFGNTIGLKVALSGNAIATLRRNVFRNNGFGIDLSAQTPSFAESNLHLADDTGINLIGSTVRVANNLLKKCGIGILTSGTNLDLTANTVEGPGNGNGYGIRLGNGSFGKVSLNTVSGNFVNIGVGGYGGGNCNFYSGSGSTRYGITQNNIDKPAGIGFSLESDQSGLTGNPRSLNAANNYWGTLPPESLINYTTGGIGSLVEYQPFLTQSVLNAGAK